MTRPRPDRSAKLLAWVTGGACALLLTQAMASPAWAQPTPLPAPNAGDLAIEKGREGVQLYERGEWEKALSLFREADALYHSPVFVLYAARSQRSLGRLLEARSIYEALVKETIEASAQATWHKAQIDGAAELKTLEAEIPGVSVVVEGRTLATRATLDGAAITLDAPTAMNPGEHRIIVIDAEQTLSKTITLRRGEGVQRVSFDLTVAKPAPRPVPKPVPPRPPGEPGMDGWRTLGIVMTTVGGASLVAGAVVGGLALDKASSARATLPPSCTADRSCASFDEANVNAMFDSAYTLANAADGLLIGGGITAAAGILILILDPGGAVVSSPTTSRGSGAVRFRF
jgi:hypothetical protein